MKTNIYKILSLLTACMLIMPLLHAQPLVKSKSGEAIISDNPRTSWIHFNAARRIHPDEVFTTYKSEMGLGADDEMKKFREYTSPATGITQYRFQQYHQGIKVYGASMNVYHRDGIALKANGKNIAGLPPVIASPVSESEALQKALDHMPGKDYAWNDQRKVEKVRNKKKDPTITLYPEGELVYMFRKGKKQWNASDFKQCWKFDIHMSRSSSERVFIDAVTGGVFNSIALNPSCNIASYPTPYNGNQFIYTSQQARCTNPTNFEMWDDCFVDIKVEDDDFGAGTDDPICNGSSTNTWLNTTGVTADAAQVLWGMRETYEFHLSQFNWNSYDNSGGSIDCTVDFQFENDAGVLHGNNAQFNVIEEDFDFGRGDVLADGTDSYTCLDIVAHEFTHGVDEFSADLNYSDESGALDESFADIFGEIIEGYTEGTWSNPTWLHAEDRTNVNYHRSFINPNAKDHPDTYLGLHWYTGSNDHGGVHTNSGVQNHFFYLLVEGKNGVNDNGDPYSVSGIGINDAKEIAWLAHMYLDGAAEYIDARDAWLEAASDLYGSCSNQAIQTGNAWHAVGVGAQSPSYIKNYTGTLIATVAHNTKEAIHKISTFGQTQITSNSGSFEVRFYAGGEIDLTPGFRAPSGTAFRARPNACSITLHTAPRGGYASFQSPGTTAVESLATGMNISVAPNPFTDKAVLHIQLETEATLSVCIYDLTGRKMDTYAWEQPMQIGKHQLEISADHLPAGIYQCVVTDGGKNTVTRKISVVK